MKFAMFENGLIEDALRRTKGNKQAAARLLKLKRTTLVAKLRRRKLATADGQLPSVIEDEADAVSRSESEDS